MVSAGPGRVPGRGTTAQRTTPDFIAASQFVVAQGSKMKKGGAGWPLRDENLWISVGTPTKETQAVAAGKLDAARRKASTGICPVSATFFGTSKLRTCTPSPGKPRSTRLKVSA